MRYGFVRIAAATPELRVADCAYNARRIMELISLAEEKEVKVLVFPELCITGYTCGDLFLQEALLNSALEQLDNIIAFLKGKDVLVAVGLPFCKGGKLYNVAAILQDGRILGIVPKLNIPNYSEFYEARHFSRGNAQVQYVDYDGSSIPFGSRVLFKSREFGKMVIGAEICEDLWTVFPPSGGHALAGATVILNLSASDETTAKGEYRRELVKTQSARLVATYIYADAGEDESTTDLVFAGHDLIAENGSILAESAPFSKGLIIAETDIGRLESDRRRLTTFVPEDAGYTMVEYSYGKLDKELPVLKLGRYIDATPFVPSDKAARRLRCEEILRIQYMGLRKRLKAIGLKEAVVGISGGLDSTLALLVTARAFDSLGLDRKGIHAVTMPCFGTTDRTYNNALCLADELGASCLEVNIRESVNRHFKDIGQDPSNYDVTYENAQARERTQVLMDLANMKGAIVIGTGDMSELALGWATYNGDHMSMYGVNASVPKTLVRHLVSFFADTASSERLGDVLRDILDTPVSPELLPPKEGKIAQKTEELVGPYELHDFFLYYLMRFGFEPDKILYLAKQAFRNAFDDETISKWLRVFYRRFFSQQFKRSCLPDGPKVGSVALSPRGDLRMPSDACAASWRRNLDR